MSEARVRSQDDIAMLGEGFYSRVSKGPKAVIDNCRDLVNRAVDADQSDQSVFSIADFGAADGGTSVDLLSGAVGRIRDRWPKRPISVTYTDLPGADFATLFRRLDGPTGYAAHHGDVSIFASGRSFYRQILPTRSLDLGFSASAMHYLSEMPGPLREHVHSVGGSPAEQATFRARSVADWESILAHRTTELAIGGRLVFAVFCVDDEGRYLGNTTSQNMFDNYARLWSEMAEEGIIDQSECLATAFQQHYKTIAETLSPFEDRSGEAHQGGLRLESAETRLVRCPFRQAFEANEIGPAQFAREFVNTHRSWTETSFRAGLNRSRPIEAQNEVLDELYRRYEAFVFADPRDHGKDLLHLYLVATRIGP